jgi:hypothetical protein
MPPGSAPQHPHTWGATTTAEKIENALAVAAAAKKLPLPWLVQDEFPDKKTVTASFRDALAKLPEAESFDAIMVHRALQAIVDGADPRSGSFQRPKPSAPPRSCMSSHSRI